MPESNEAVKKFDEWSKMLSPPFVMYADMEAILVKPDEQNNILQRHEPCMVGSYLAPHKDLDMMQSGVLIHEGRSCIEDFCKYLEKDRYIAMAKIIVTIRN